jgi:hypothetical protein
LSFLTRAREPAIPEPDSVLAPTPDANDDEAAGWAPGRSKGRRVAAAVLTILACLLVWFPLVGPNQLGDLTWGSFLRVPVEAVVVAGLVLVLPAKYARVLALVVGVVLGLLTILKITDMGFYEALDRPFNPVFDRDYFGPAVGVLRDSIGTSGAVIAVIVIVVLIVAIIVFTALATLRLTRLVTRHRTVSGRAVIALGLVWVIGAVLGAPVVDGSPVASSSAASMAYDEARDFGAAVRDRQVFDQAMSVDAFRDTPGSDLLTGLRGKDVLVVFVESYGKVAVQGTSFSPGVDAALDADTRRLDAAGFSSRSGWLTSPTFGGISWLAHSTLQSGLWVDNQQRYDELVNSDRFTLSAAFKRAGWRTVADVPSNREDWPEGTSFYHYDKIYDEWNVGYEGPKFSYAAMPDQYTFAALQRNELAQPHAPLMAEIDLVSSHTPWTPLPHMVPWSELGDGSIFDSMAAEGETPSTLWRDPDAVRASYAKSIEYSLRALVSFVQHYGDKNLVMVVLGDHQPWTMVSGQNPGHDVPISIIAHDPAVLDKISGWDWHDGMRPGPDAPVWPMDAFRDRFLTAYGPGGQSPD